MDPDPAKTSRSGSATLTNTNLEPGKIENPELGEQDTNGVLPPGPGTRHSRPTLHHLHIHIHLWALSLPVVPIRDVYSSPLFTTRTFTRLSFVSSLFLFPIRDVYPWSRISDPTTKKREEKHKISCLPSVLPFIVAINNYYIFWTGTVKIWINWQRIYVFLTQKIFAKH